MLSLLLKTRLRVYRNYIRHNFDRTTSMEIGIIVVIFLLLDEATNGLDPSGSYIFKKYLKKFCANGGTVLFSTHIIETAEHLCNRIVILNKGDIVKQLKQADWEHLRENNSSLEMLFMRLVGMEEE